MSIYKHLDYRQAIKTGLDELKKYRKSATLQNLAEHCRIQKTYLSKVLNHSGNLNADQIYLACEYLNFNDQQNMYTTLLQQLDSCTVDKRKQKILEKINKIQKEQNASESHLSIKTEKINMDSLYEYYSDPYHQIIHMLFTIDKYKKEPTEIKNILNLKFEKIQHYIDRLIYMNIIKIEAGHIKVLQDNLHLPSSSPLMKSYRSLTRLQALEKINTLDDENAYTFTVVFSTDKAIKEKIHQKFLEFLKETQRLVSKSKEEELYQMNFDLIKWT